MAQTCQQAEKRDLNRPLAQCALCAHQNPLASPARPSSGGYHRHADHHISYNAVTLVHSLSVEHDCSSRSSIGSLADWIDPLQGLTTSLSLECFSTMHVACARLTAGTRREHAHRQRDSVVWTKNLRLFLAVLVAAWAAQIKNRERQRVVWTRIKLSWVFA